MESRTALVPLLLALGACAAKEEVSPEEERARGGLDPDVAGPSLVQPRIVSTDEPDEVVPADPPSIEVDEDGVRRLTFRDLSLVGTDVTGLLDLVFSTDVDDVEWEFPEHLQALDGEEVTIAGYMIALDYEGDEVTRFMLVRDLAACCFGGIPRPDEWIDVTLETPCEYFIYVPVRATGVMSVGLDKHEDGLVASVFQITQGTARLERMR